ncbi:MAG: hypothetical protein RI945_232 [Candidatus Parcubacteria bacterium]
MKFSNTFKFLVSIIIAEGTGLIGSIFTMPNIPTWYADIVKPSWVPPSSVFAPVWTLLFFLMGLAFFLVWKKGFKMKNVKTGMTMFLVQLLLNIIWSILFFGLQNPGAAFVEIIILWIFILFTIISFSKVSKLAAWLLVPYIAWVTFASILNYTIWILN